MLFILSRSLWLTYVNQQQTQQQQICIHFALSNENFSKKSREKFFLDDASGMASSFMRLIYNYSPVYSHVTGRFRVYELPP